jgi:uncharacterized protein (TIGR02246 family)
MTVGTDDETAIRALVHRYTTAIGTRDADAWSATWADDGVWDLGGGATTGRDAIRAAWVTAMEHFVEVGHVATFGSLDVDGDVASGTWVVEEATRDADGHGFAFTADYHDRYVRTAEGWRFAERRLVMRP